MKNMKKGKGLIALLLIVLLSVEAFATPMFASSVKADVQGESMGETATLKGEAMRI